VTKGDGSVEIHPDSGKAPYSISSDALDKVIENKIIKDVYNRFNED
jgi:hypothetical protein